ncbi:MAG: M48 family metalloprotease [Candidatus Cyclobacteriaceae bacterium M3_2C_046]
MKTGFFTIITILALFLIESCATNPVTGKKDFMLISTKQEIAMGEQADPEITAFFGVYNDKQLQRFIQRKGESMADISHRPNLDYEFKIVDSPVINAFAVPGGYVYFTRGIMAQFNNEAEFAGVLGHEIGHIAARHSAKQYSKAMLAEIGLAVGSVVSPEFAQFSDLARTGLGILFLKYGRDAERQSDRLGVQYSTKIGYDANKMAGFFNVLQAKQEESGQEVPSFLSTHPHPGERFETVRQLATQWQQEINLDDYEVNRESYLQMIDGIVYGKDPRQGFVQNNTFYHPEMAFSFPVPRGWILQNTTQQVQMAPENGQALISFSIAQGNTLEQAANTLLQQFQLKTIQSQRVQVNDFNALAIVAEQELQEQAVRVLSYLIKDGNRIYNFMGVTAYDNFNNYYNTLNNTMNGFERVTNRQILNAEPTRIDVVEVEKPGTIVKVLQRNGVEKNNLEEVALLNGMTLSQSIGAGTLIKVLD